jgi:hypothetical protein
MATISNVTLKIDVVQTTATVTIDYDITWNPFDRAANQPYREVLRVVGDDDDGQDDPLVGGTLSPSSPFFPVTVRSNGQATTHRHFVRAIPASILDEDSSDIVPSDEIKARVTLTPFGPVTATGVSNVVQIVV